MKTVPNRQKKECGHMRESLIAQELQALKYMSLEKKKEEKKSQKKQANFSNAWTTNPKCLTLHKVQAIQDVAT